MTSLGKDLCRMSRDNGAPHDGSTQPNTRESRRRSLWQLPVSSNHSPSPSGQRGAVAEKATQDTPALRLSDIIKDGSSLDETPDEARTWLLAFGDVIPGTEVSSRLVDIREELKENKGTTSLLPLLMRWIPLWTQKADQERKENRSAKSASNKGQKHLDWLLQYTSDFLELGHAGFDPKELSQVVEVTTALCLNANRPEDINAGIRILYTISRNFDYPPHGLEQTLVILCASVTNLPEVPEHLYDCSRVLAGSNLHGRFMDTLYSYVRSVTSDDKTKSLSRARGATRLLRHLVDEGYKDGEHVLDLGRFFDALCVAVQAGIFRFCFDILNALHSILASGRPLHEIMAIDFNQMLELVRLCLQMTPTGQSDTDAARVNSPRITTLEEGRDRQYERHFRDREAVSKKISQDFLGLWDSLCPAHHDAIHELFLSFPKFASQDLSMLSLEQTKDKYLLSTDPSVREEYAEIVFQGIAQNSALPSVVRSKAFEILVSAAVQLVNTMAEPGDIPHKAYVFIYHGLLDQLAQEQDPRVSETLLASLEIMVANHEEAAKEKASTTRLIEKILGMINNQAPKTPLEEAMVVTATKILVTVFCHSLHVDGATAVQAYEVLLKATSLQCRYQAASLVAKQLLFRLRADDAGFIFVSSESDSETIANALLRTRASTEAFNNDIPAVQRHSTSSHGSSAKSNNVDPQWIYPDTEETKYPFAGRTSRILNIKRMADSQVQAELDIDAWLMSIIRRVQADQEWETYSYTIVHAGAQLNNISLWLNSVHAIVKLRQVLCEQVVNNTFREPPSSTGLKKSDVALVMYDILVALIPFATIKSEAIQKGFGDDMVRAFLSGIGGAWEGTSRGCIHALSICSLEIPASVATLYPTIIDKMSKNMTQAHLTVDILEFMIQVALLPEMHSKLNPDEIQMIFGICIQYLEKTREQQQASMASPVGRMNPTGRHSGMNFRRPPYRASMMTDIGLPQYTAALAYHNILFWFLSLRLDIRAKFVHWIVPRLIWKNSRGEESIDEQSEVLIDMMQRTAFSDLGETVPTPDFASPEDGPVSSASWINGLSIVTVETAGRTGKTQLTKRQASGTTYAIYQQLTAPMPSHHRPGYTQIRDEEATTEILPPHVMLQRVASAGITTPMDQPILLPQEAYVPRALEGIDRIPTVTSHKIGVLFVGVGQDDENEYLANTSGSKDYARLLDEIGYEVSLEPPLRFKPQGLEYSRDGTHTIAWRDRVEEIVYLVPTMMPTDLEEDPHCVTKKSHVGNCHVNIIFNRSGVDWDMDHLKSQLNYVNIVVRPACRGGEEVDLDFMPGFYWVRVITRDDLANISPAAEPKIISAAQLAIFIRTLALNANMYCQTWNTKDQDSEFPSAWRARLQQIKRLKERVLSKPVDKPTMATGKIASNINTPPSTSSGRKTPVPREEAGNERKDGTLASQLDFSSWTI